jgi:hypothetical protein
LANPEMVSWYAATGDALWAQETGRPESYEFAVFGDPRSKRRLVAYVADTVFGRRHSRIACECGTTVTKRQYPIHLRDSSHRVFMENKRMSALGYELLREWNLEQFMNLSLGRAAAKSLYTMDETGRSWLPGPTIAFVTAILKAGRTELDRIGKDISRRNQELLRSFIANTLTPEQEAEIVRIKATCVEADMDADDVHEG